MRWPACAAALAAAASVPLGALALTGTQQLTVVAPAAALELGLWTWCAHGAEPAAVGVDGCAPLTRSSAERLFELLGGGRASGSSAWALLVSARVLVSTAVAAGCVVAVLAGLHCCCCGGGGGCCCCLAASVSWVLVLLALLVAAAGTACAVVAVSLLAAGRASASAQLPAVVVSLGPSWTLGLLCAVTLGVACALLLCALCVRDRPLMCRRGTKPAPATGAAALHAG